MAEETEGYAKGREGAREGEPLPPPRGGGGENYPESAWGVRPRRRGEPSASEAERSARRTPGPARHTTRGAHSPAQSTRRYDPCWTVVVAPVHAGIRHPAAAPRCHQAASTQRQARGRGAAIARSPGDRGGLIGRSQTGDTKVSEEREKDPEDIRRTTTVSPRSLRFIELSERNTYERLRDAFGLVYIYLFFPFFSYLGLPGPKRDGVVSAVNEKQSRFRRRRVSLRRVLSRSRVTNSERDEETQRCRRRCQPSSTSART